jgi:hypothetical protein
MNIVTSEPSKNGTFSSPNYPSNYPGKTHCRYDFHGSPKERVQIIFTDFNLYHPDGAHTLDRNSERFKGQREKEEERRKERERE